MFNHNNIENNFKYPYPKEQSIFDIESKSITLGADLLGNQDILTKLNKTKNYESNEGHRNHPRNDHFLRAHAHERMKKRKMNMNFNKREALSTNLNETRRNYDNKILKLMETFITHDDQDDMLTKSVQLLPIDRDARKRNASKILSSRKPHQQRR